LIAGSCKISAIDHANPASAPAFAGLMPVLMPVLVLVLTVVHLSVTATLFCNNALSWLRRQGQP